MRRRLFSIGSTAVYLHLATVLVGVYMALMGFGWTLLIAGVSVLLHEAAHAAVAAVFGAPPAEIELTPLGALMRQEDEARLSPGKRLLMLLAGPAMSLLLCWVALILTQSAILPVAFGRMLFLGNLTLVVMNLLPALPLDGGRLLALLLSLWLRQETVRRVMRIIGTALGFVCLLANMAVTLRLGGWNFSLAAAGCFLMYAGAVATTSAAMAELRMLMDRRILLERRGALPCRWVAITERFPLRQAVAQMKPGCHTMFVLLESGTQQQLAQLTEAQVIGIYLEHPGGGCEMLLHSS